MMTHPDIQQLGHHQETHGSPNAPSELRVVLGKEVGTELAEDSHVRHALGIHFMLHGPRTLSC